MAAEPTPVAEVQDTDAPPKKGKSPVLLILLTALVVGPGAVFGYMKFLAPPGPAEAAEPEPQEAVTFPLPSQTINLADGNRYLRLRVTMGFKMPLADAVSFRTWAAEVLQEDDAVPPTPPEEMAERAEEDPSEAVKNLQYALHTNMAQIEDALIREVGSVTYDSMTEDGAKDSLESMLLERFQEVLSDTGLEIIPVERVYFTEFIMQ